MMTNASTSATKHATARMYAQQNRDGRRCRAASRNLLLAGPGGGALSLGDARLGRCDVRWTAHGTCVPASAPPETRRLGLPGDGLFPVDEHFSGDREKRPGNRDRDESAQDAGELGTDQHGAEHRERR